jgi:hypothetical protein
MLCITPFYAGINREKTEGITAGRQEIRPVPAKSKVI